MSICFIVNMFDLKREYLDYTLNVWRRYLSMTYFHVRAILDVSAPVLGSTSVILFLSNFSHKFCVWHFKNHFVAISFLASVSNFSGSYWLIFLLIQHFHEQDLLKYMYKYINITMPCQHQRNNINFDLKK